MTQAGPAVASHRLQIVRTPYALTAVMFLIAAAWYAVGIERSGITSADVDPVSRIPAQDEAVYAREAIHMSSSGHWLTPVYMGRYALNKPPLLQWLAAGSVRAFGISAWAVRLPSLLAASATTVLVFWVVWRTHSLLPAVAAALLLASSHLFFVFARLAMTDMLLTLWITVSLVTVLRDPRLERTSSVLIFGAASGTAILTKAAAGVLPLIALMGLAVFGPRDQRPSFRRVLAAAALTAAIAIPWHVYQLIAHTRWFVAEYILTQHFAVGLAAPPQYSNENHLLFYARRLWLMDPVLCIAAAIAIPTIARGLRKRAALALWPAMLLLELFAFRYRSAYYLLPLLPMLAILAGEVIARVPLRGQVVCAAFLLACAVIKTAYGDEPWGVPAGVVSARPIAASLERYCARRRASELIVIGGNDQFYASDLPLYRLRYCWLEKRAEGHEAPLDFARLGINVTVGEFNHLDRLLPIWRKRLADFGLDSDAPVATVISAASPQEIAQLISTHPESDFWIPARLLRGLDLVLKHDLEPTAGDGYFLLARQNGSLEASGPCHL